jgi:multicomponent Na+:H+ antiporter subunit D
MTMSNAAYLAPLPVLIPLSVAAMLAAGNKVIPRAFADALSIAATVASGIVSALLLSSSSAQPIVYWFGGWTPRAGVALGISFAIGPLNAALATFVAVLVLAALVFSLRYFESVGPHYNVLMLVFLGAMCGFSLTGDLFNLFVFFELMSAAAFALCGYKVEAPESLQGALNFAVTNTIGAFLVLTGIALLYGKTGALNMAQIGRTLDRTLSAGPDGLVIAAFVLIMCGFFIKAALVPFHFWLADAHAVAPTPVCILFSGVMVELGLYAVVRVYWAVIDGPFAAHRTALRDLLLVVGALTAVVGGIMCFGQRHLKRLLAFSTVSHVGLMTIGFACLSYAGLAGTALYVVGHGLAKSALFIVSGILLHRFGTVDELELHGRGRELRFTGIVFVIAAFGLAALPPFISFAGEHSIEGAAEDLHQSWVAWVFFFSSVLTSGAVFRVAGRVFRGMGKGEEADTAGAKKIPEARETRGHDGRVPATMLVPAVALVCIALAIGIVHGVHAAALTGAAELMDHAGFAARTLESAVVPVQTPDIPHHAALSSIARAVGANLAALALAWFALSKYWPRKKLYGKVTGAIVYQVRCLHSGHVGDYVAFIIFGVAVFGGVLALLIR